MAIGAAFYARLREQPRRGAAPADPRRQRARLLRRPAGSGTAADGADGRLRDAARHRRKAPRSTLDHAFSVTTNQPVAFTLYSSTGAHDALDDHRRRSAADDDVHRHAPLVTVMRYGKRSRRVALGVGLRVVFTETGTLELWCESRSTEHRWRLAFNLRAAEADPLDDRRLAAGRRRRSEDSRRWSRRRRSSARDQLDPARCSRRRCRRRRLRCAPEALVGELENDARIRQAGVAARRSSASWPTRCSRSPRAAAAAGARSALAEPDRLLRPARASAPPPTRGGSRSCARSTPRAWRSRRTSSARSSGWCCGSGSAPGSPPGISASSRSASAGSSGSARRSRRGSTRRSSARAGGCCASLERLDAGQRAKLGDELMEHCGAIRGTARGCGRSAASARACRSTVRSARRCRRRSPSAGSTACSAKGVTPDAAAAIVQIGARTDDPARDIPSSAAETAAARLLTAGFVEPAEQLQNVLPADRADAGRVFGESLPEGLQLA